MYLAIIVLPLLGSIVSGFFGRKVGVSGAQLIAMFMCDNHNIYGYSSFCWSSTKQYTSIFIAV